MPIKGEIFLTQILLILPTIWSNKFPSLSVTSLGTAGQAGVPGHLDPWLQEGGGSGGPGPGPGPAGGSPHRDRPPVEEAGGQERVVHHLCKSWLTFNAKVPFQLLIDVHINKEYYQALIRFHYQFDKTASEISRQNL